MMHQSDEESVLLLLPEKTLGKQNQPQSGRGSALLTTVALMVFLGVGLLGYSSSSSLGAWRSSSSLSAAENSCSQLFSSLSSFKANLIACRSSVANGATAAICFGSSSDCAAGKAENIMSGSVSASGTVDQYAAVQSVEVSGTFSLGSFLYVLGNTIGGVSSTASPAGSAVLYGDWIGTEIVVQAVGSVSGKAVYMAEQGPHTKMVMEDGTAKYYTGRLSEFSANNWDLYSGVGDHYKVRLPNAPTSSNASKSPVNGGSLRNLVGELANIAVEGALSIELETNNALEVGLSVGVTGAVSVQNDISCKDPLSCALYQLVPASARNSKPKEYSKLGGLEFSYKLSVENLKEPTAWEVEVAIQMSGVTIVNKKAWLRDLDGAGPKLYVLVTPEDPPALGISMPLDVCVQNCKSTTPTDLHFAGSLELDGVNVAGTLEFNSWWKNALGIPILHLGYLKVGLAVPMATPTVISAISLGGRVCLGKANVCVPAADGSVVNGNQIAAAAYMGVNFDPTKADENFVFVAITETSLEKILQVFEDGMNFPNLRSALPPPLLASGLYPFKTIPCTSAQVEDFVNNLDCFARMSFSPGGEVEITASSTGGVLVIPQGVSLSARINFMGVQLQMKLDLNTDIFNPYFKMVGALSPVKIMNVVTLTKSSSDFTSGPLVRTNCEPLQLTCSMTGQGYVDVPLLTLKGEFTMLIAPVFPGGMRTTMDFTSLMFGLYDMSVHGEYDSPLLTYLDLQISLSSSGHKSLADALAARAQQFLDAVNTLAANAQNLASSIPAKMAAKCSSISGPTYSVGPVSAVGYFWEKDFDIGKRFAGKYYGFHRSFSITFGTPFQILPKLDTSVSAACTQAVNAATDPLVTQVNNLLNSLNLLVSEARSSLAGLSNPTQYFALNALIFAAHFDLFNSNAGMLLDLNMVVAKKAVVLNKFKVGYSIDLQGMVYDEVVKQALPVLGKLQSMYDIYNSMDAAIAAKVNAVGSTATQTFDSAKIDFNNKFATAQNTLTSKTLEYQEGARLYLLGRCKDACPDGCCGLGVRGWCTDRCNDAI